MSQTAHDLLRTFDSLPATEQHAVAVEILRRYSASGDLPDAAFDELAAELFHGYDAEEAGRAAS